MVIFHSYVSLPEGIIIIRISQKGTIKTWDYAFCEVLESFTTGLSPWFLPFISIYYITIILILSCISLYTLYIPVSCLLFATYAGNSGNPASILVPWTFLASWGAQFETLTCGMAWLRELNSASHSSRPFFGLPLRSKFDAWIYQLCVTLW